MTLLDFGELWHKLTTGDESVEIEAKRGEEIGKSILETISAFSNEPDRNGGYLLLGVSKKDSSLFPDYEITGVSKPDQVQASLATQCRGSFNITLRPIIDVVTRNGKAVIIAHIPEVQPPEKPVFIKSRGITHGAFRRIGSTDHRCTDDDLAMFLQGRSHQGFDETPIPETTADDFEPRALREYRRLRADVSPSASELSLSDEELLDSLGATIIHEEKRCATIAGLLLFGKAAALRRHFPMMRVDYIRVAGREWMADPEKRYEYALEMREPLILMIPRLISQITDDIPKGFSLPEYSPTRKDIPLIPYRVIREAVVNALMHRNYRVHSTVQIIRFSNRLEIHNPGYSLVAEDRLGEPRATQTRNPRIADVLHDLHYAETKGTGIRTMREQMAQANLTVPVFLSDRQNDNFSVTLLTVHFLEQEDINWLKAFKHCRLTNEEARAMVFLRKTRIISNFIFRTINRGVDALGASSSLQKLRKLGLIEPRGKGAGIFYIPTEAFDTAGKKLSNGASAKRSLPDNTLSGWLSLPDSALSGGFPGLPSHIAEAVEKLGRRATPEEVRYVILKLCKWRALQVTELATILNRNRRYIQDSYVTPMVKSGEIEYTYPDNPAHPHQAYRLKSDG